MFEGRRLVIATKHAKEKVIAPLLEQSLGVRCFVTDNLDTDELGTFTGETERKDDPVTTARKKCLKAIELTGCDLAVANEGSFGAHPSFYFVHADDEIVVFLDQKNNLEIIARSISTETNFNGKRIQTEAELKAFAETAKFPSHGLIIRNTKNSVVRIEKGITDWNVLLNLHKQFIDEFGSAYVETDMRAMYNPMRMDVIKEATLKLAEKINSLCPQCGTPGFAVTEVIPGLPCEWCKQPTNSTLSYISTCAKCKYTFENKYPHQKYYETPMYCNNCNP